jgi:hypothetical protein
MPNLEYWTEFELLFRPNKGFELVRALLKTPNWAEFEPSVKGFDSLMG